MLRNTFKLSQVILFICILNFLFFHLPFFNFVFDNASYQSLHGAILITSLFALVIIANYLVFYLFFSLNYLFGKIITSVFFIINAVSVYFINTYSVIIDESMVGNILNTNFDESSSFFSYKLVLYLLVFGILPSILLFKLKIRKISFRDFFKNTLISFGLILIFVVANASNVLWVDKHSKVLGGLAMPWSYTVNIPRYYIHKYQENEKEIMLPDATITNNEKSVVILVIGESARSKNFSLYGYDKNTNPLLSQTENLYHFNATSCATYTTAGLKCLLEHQNTSELYEILPNYLDRNDVAVIWRTTNWGEPPVHIEKYQKVEDIAPNCKDDKCNYDEILLKDLKDEIVNAKQNKVLIILHTSTSHGPTYSKKYPKEFEIFTPVCHSVELAKCSNQELVNAYDNTIVYTDYILHSIIDELKDLKDYKSTMIYVSDHGESLGEKNLYMHGVPMSIAPKEQYEIPFIVWVSENSKQLKDQDQLSQNHVFHSVLNFLSVSSPIYNETMNIFK